MEPDRPRLPADPDLEAAQDSAAKPRLVHLSWANIAIVTIGGTVGTGLRYVIGLTVPHWDGVPVATVGINVVGAFLLGLLLELLADRSLDTGWSRRIRLGVGTGVLGGFTAYSASPPTPPWLAAVHRGRTAGYALGTVLLGAAATIAGIWLARRRCRWRALRRRGPDECAHDRLAGLSGRSCRCRAPAGAGRAGPWLGPPPYPVATTVINLSGSLLLGVC